MHELELPPFSKARIWFDRAKPALATPAHVERRLEASSTCCAKEGGVTLEAWVPRGARAEYGLLGFYEIPVTRQSRSLI